MGAVELGHVRRRWGIGRSVGYALVARLVEAGLLERIATLPGDPTLLRASDDGITYARLGLPAAKVGPGQVDHWLACADVALWAEERWGPEALTCERELRLHEREAREPIGSCVVGELPGGRPMLHRPDLLISDSGRRMAIEVELTVKAPGRLEQIVRSWRRARHVEKVLYVVPAGPTHRAVARAVAATHAQERVIVRELEKVNGDDAG